MSAYICDDKTISQAAEFMLYGRPDHQCSVHVLNVKELARALWAMNVRAVHSRYEGREGDPGSFRFHPGKLAIPLAQSIKTLECLRYQCSEGNVPEADLYQTLERIIDSAKYTLLRRVCPEYDNATWGAYEPPADAPKVYSLSAMMRKD